MTLSDFIEADLDGLISDWADYARIISPEESELDEKQLRNSARQLLLGIAADMREVQSTSQQEAKSHGERPDPDSAFNLIGRGHADDRREHGFNINTLIAEYRALRASVLRRWQRACPVDSNSLQEMIRFNEAVDQMVSESVRQFAERNERIRDLFSGVLAHDMRSPLGAIINSTHVLMQDENLSATSVRAGVNLRRSTERLRSMIDDLFVFTRTRLGSVLPVESTQQNFGTMTSGAVDEVRAAHPDAQISLRTVGDLAGTWDAGRINQLVVNLLTNAVKYGDGIVNVEVVGDDTHVALSVANGGTPIPANALPTLFDPLTRATPAGEHGRTSSGIGLGLYICRCIANAHGGEIRVDATGNQTIFTARIPRSPYPSK